MTPFNLFDVAVGQNQWYHFGVGAPPILVYFSGDWDVHWGCEILTHGHVFQWEKRKGGIRLARDCRPGHRGGAESAGHRAFGADVGPPQSEGRWHGAVPAPPLPESRRSASFRQAVRRATDIL